MKPLPLLMALLIIPALAGCNSSREKEQIKLREAYMAGQQSAQSQFPPQLQNPQPPQQAGITVIGEVRRNQLLWRPQLTLSQAIHEAEYLGIVQPRSVVVVRSGHRYQVSVADLLRGKDDPEILPGDVIDIQR